MKTYSPKPEHIERRWFVLDASGQVLGRLATEVAVLLRGKHKPIFAPHMDTGDHVVVINADKVELTGNKNRDKIAYRHSGYPGGIKGVPYGELLQLRPVAAIERSVRGMLPKNRLGRQMIKKLHVVAGGEHPHGAQKPVPLGVGERPVWEGLPTAARLSARAGSTAPTPVKPSTRSSEPGERPAAGKPRSAPKKPTAAKEPSIGPGSAAEEPAAQRPAAKKTTAKKPSAAKKPAAKKTAAKKPSAAKKTTAKKTTAKKTTAKKTTTKTTTAKATTAKKKTEE